jgi:hypothetical protein
MQRRIADALRSACGIARRSDLRLRSRAPREFRKPDPQLISPWSKDRWFAGLSQLAYNPLLYKRCPQTSP